MGNSQRLSGLLYYDPSCKKHGELKKGLEEYRFLLWAVSMAVRSFESGDFEKFDSLVGENACQIRAVKIVWIASKEGEIFKGIEEGAEKAIKVLDGVLCEIHSLMHKGVSLEDVLQQYGLDISLTSRQAFIVQSYLLSEMKECYSDGELVPSILRKERCSPSMIRKKYPEVSYSFVEKTAKKLRRLLSIASVEFVREVARELGDHGALRMMGDDFEVEHNTLSCVPTFWTFKALFSLVQKEGIPLLMHVKFLDQVENGFRVVEEEFLYFKLCEKAQAYVVVKPTEEELALPTCVVQGVVCSKERKVPSKKEWRERVSGYSVFDMILAMGADHRQYPNPELVVDVEDGEYEQYKRLAQEKGFALDNPTTFFIQHIYCSQPRRVIDGGLPKSVRLPVGLQVEKFASFQEGGLHGRILSRLSKSDSK